jgi:glycosyltransferase involved in cell wall biosynthesis
MTNYRCCAVVPTYDNPETVRAVVERIRLHLPEVFVVDDGSGDAGRAACQALERDQLARVIRLNQNCGKGVAVKAGIEAAASAGFSHAFQIDADGQHDIDAIPEFLEASAKSPDHAVFGSPIYDDTAPSVRLIARKITRFWVDLEVGRGVIQDAMVGFRIYPLAQTLALKFRCDRMSFDVEVAVLLAWAGVPIENLPVKIRYLSAEEGGLSHFHPLLDNLRLFWLHSRLCTMASLRWCFGWLARPIRSIRSGPS